VEGEVMAEKITPEAIEALNTIVTSGVHDKEVQGLPLEDVAAAYGLAQEVRARRRAENEGDNK
jgi:hypothetical protein